MPSLKDLKNRINSVKSTRKITQAMQMVAAAKTGVARRRPPRRHVPMRSGSTRWSPASRNPWAGRRARRGFSRAPGRTRRICSL